MSAVETKWDASPTQPVDGYNVYLRKDIAGGIYGKSNIGLIRGLLEHRITNLSPGGYTAYETAVRGENESDPSNIATFTILFDSNFKPNGLQSTIVDEMAGDVDFTWNYVSGISQYNLYIKDSVGTFVKQNSSPINSNDFSVTGLSADSYEWKVAALYNGEEVESDVKTFEIGT